MKLILTLALMGIIILPVRSFAESPTLPVREINLDAELGQGFRFSSLAYSPDGKILASSGGNNDIIFWDSSSGRRLQTLKGHSGHVNAIDFSTDGKILASGGEDNAVIIWDIDGNILRRIPDVETQASSQVSRTIIGVKFNPDGKSVAVASRASLYIVNSFSGSVTLKKDFFKVVKYGSGDCSSERIETERISSLSYNKEGTRLAVGTKEKIYIITLPSGRILKNLDTGNIGSKHAETITSISYSPNVEEIVSYGFDHSTIKWESTTGEIVWKIINSNPVNGIVKNEGLCSACHIGHDGAPDMPRILIAPSVGAQTVTFSPDGKKLATFSKERALTIRDSETGRRVKTFQALTTGVTILSIAFSPDGNEIAVFISQLNKPDKVSIYNINSSDSPQAVLENNILNLIDERDTKINIAYSQEVNPSSENRWKSYLKNVPNASAITEEERLTKEYDALIEKEKKAFEQKTKGATPSPVKVP